MDAISGSVKGDDSLDSPERCIKLGFDAPFDGNPTAIHVTVPYLITSVLEVITTERVETANQKLEASGIAFEYVERDVKVLQQPAEMQDWEVYQMIWDALADRYDGPWVLTVEVNP